MSRSKIVTVLATLGPLLCACTEEPPAIAAATESPAASEWRQPDPANLLYMQLERGEVILELAPRLAPRNVGNIRTLVGERYYDGLAIIRSQDNYVVQWGDPAADSGDAKPIGSAVATVVPEFFRPRSGLSITPIDSRDAYADHVGFADGFPVGSDDERVWLTHCYGMVGVARGMETDSGNGTSLYVVTGHAPRHLDRNITLVGRVLSGIENLTALPRGKGQLGFYENENELTPIVSIRSGDELDARTELEVMRTDTPEFAAYVESRTHRTEEWFVDPTGRIEICNIHPPVMMGLMMGSEPPRRGALTPSLT